jgi:hypothetical protein
VNVFANSLDNLQKIRAIVLLATDSMSLAALQLDSSKNVLQIVIEQLLEVI